MHPYLDEILKDGEKALERYRDLHLQETLELDFKCKADPSHGRFEKSDKKEFGAALSGFSNSMGGILVWGVDARKGLDGVDCVQALKPIADIRLFHSEAMHLAAQLVMPRNEGVRIEAIPSMSAHGAGYLLVQIPRSERRPHRSEAAGDRQYFKRVTDNMIAMEHYEIEDAFKRMSVPELDIDWHPRPGGQSDIRAERLIHLVIGLQNASRVTARFPYLSVRDCTELKLNGKPLAKNSRSERRKKSLVPTPMNVSALPPGVARSWGSEWKTFAGGADIVLNPGQSLPMLMAWLTLYIAGDFDRTIDGVPVEEYSLSFEYRFGCEHLAMVEGTFTLDGGSIWAASAPYRT